MGNAPQVTVVIPGLNVRNCVASAIDSALAQSGVTLEVIVVDDGSQDGTATFVEQAYRNDARVSVIRRETNGGPAAARNIAFRHARGDWLALLDADDWWRPDRLQKMLARASDYDFIADNIMGFDVGKGAETWPIYTLTQDRELKLIDFLRPSDGKRHDYGYLQPLIRRSFLLENELFYNEKVRVSEDLLFNIHFMASGGRALLLHEPGYVYALPVGPLSGTASPHSRTGGSNIELNAALTAFEQRYEGMLGAPERRALATRRERIQQNAPVAEFHLAKARSDYRSMLRLALTSPQVRRRIADRISVPLGGHAAYAGLLTLTCVALGGFLGIGSMLLQVD